MRQRWATGIATNVIIGLIYFGAGRLGLSLAVINPSASAVWPATGVALAAFLLFGNRVWPGIFAAAFLVNLTTSGSVPASVLIAAGNTLEGGAGAYLVNRFAQGRRAFEQPADIYRFMLGGGLLGPIISATIGVSSLVALGLSSRESSLPVWLTWWLGDATGAMIVAPVILAWAALPRLETHRPRVLEAMALVAATILLGVAAFGGLTLINAGKYPLEFIVLPLVVWAAFRFGASGASGITLLLSSIALWGTVQGSGSFAGEATNVSLLLLQAFMAVISITGLVLASVVTKRKGLAAENLRLFAEAQQWNSELEQRIRERTAELTASVAALQGEVVERQEIQSKLERYQAQLRDLSAHVQAAREEERANAAREIHDGLGQELTVLKMEVARLSRTIEQQPPDELRAGLQAFAGELDAMIELVRSVAANLRPGILDDFGLLPAIQWQLQDFQRRTGVAGRFTSNVESLDLPSEQATALFRVCQEALTNVARHAQASEVVISIDKHPDGLVVRITDNGRGIESAELSGRSSLGLLGMRERVTLLQGVLDISGEPGQGTTVQATLPIN